jgi:hypothetical protein
MLKKILAMVYALVAVIVLVGCGDDDSLNPSETVELGDSMVQEANEKTNIEKKVENKKVTVEEQSSLKEYTTEQIEYARVWLQLGPNQEIEELNITHIAAGTPLNEDDETSAVYPEDVIQLAGSRLVDGSVTYSGNGDGTINVYNVPLRWDGEYPAGEQFYKEILENTKLVSIETGNDEAVLKLIKLQKNEK